MRNALLEYLLRGQKQMEPKVYLLFHILFLKGLNVYTTSTWTAEVPQTISALQGSCVVVPCKFNYPDREIKPTDLTGIWHTTNQDIYIYHPDSSKVMEEFRGRTNLIGDLARKDCSLRINHLKKTDNGPFIFRIEIHDFDKYSYTDNMVSIEVQDSPRLNVSGEIKAGDAVTASCSASHSCPTEQPHLIWSHCGATTNQSEELPNGQWRVTSSLTFTATDTDHNQHLTCTAKYQQVTSVQSSRILNVTYAPVRVEVQPESPVVKEGDAVEMQCSSDSNPPAHGYQWYNITGALLSEERIYKLHNVSRHINALYCVAINTEGQKKSTPAKISVEYAPEIKEGSACSAKAEGVTCLCVVDSQPPPEITWLLGRGSDASSGTERHDSITLGTLRGTQRLTEFTCQASNSRGNASAVFIAPQSDAPVRVEVQPESPVVKEGDAVEMQCSSDSNPPAHGYQWYNITGALLSEERIYKLHNMSRHINALYCVAINTEGQKKSTPAKISVEYAPEIKEGSACSAKAEGVTCLCVVDSQPPPEITWLLPRGSDASSGTERHGSITLGTLRGTQRLTEFTCQASNSRGNASAVFTAPRSDAPVRVEVQPESPVVKEGDAVEMQCSSDSNPPAHGYQWYDITGALLSEERIYKLHNVSRNIKALYCVAINTEGQKKSTPAKISVEYAPEIKEGSACSVKAEGVTCLCVVDSQPPPEITWLLPRGSDASSGTERHGSITLGTLRGTQRLTEFTCQASNSRGNASAVFTAPRSDAPVRVEVQPESPVVKEGDAVEMQCSSDSNPPAHGYQWYNITGALLSEERIYKLHNVSRHINALYCVAINTEGQRKSTPAEISVEYAPEIKEGSACSVKAEGVTCLCVVDSQPPPEITWLLPRGSDASSGTERHGSITLGTLRGTQRLTEFTCQASNSRGNASAVFTAPRSGSGVQSFQRCERQYTSLVVASVLLVTGMLIVVWLARRKRHNRDQPVTGMDDAGSTLEGTSYAMTARKEEKGINSGCYVNNEQMYGNTEVGEEEDVYTCVEDASD